MTYVYHFTRKENVYMLSRTGLIKKIALHDDSDGLLATYEIIQSKEYFTIELSDEIQ